MKQNNSSSETKIESTPKRPYTKPVLEKIEITEVATA